MIISIQIPIRTCHYFAHCFFLFYFFHNHTLSGFTMKMPRFFCSVKNNQLWIWIESIISFSTERWSWISKKKISMMILYNFFFYFIVCVQLDILYVQFERNCNWLAVRLKYCKIEGSFRMLSLTSIFTQVRRHIHN